MRRVVPVPEIAGCDALRILVVAQRRERDGPETAEVPLRRVPVDVLGCRSLLVDVAEVEEEVRLPAADQLGDIGRFLLATGAVTGCGDDEGSSGGGGGPAGRGERRRCRLLAAVAERDGERGGLRAGSVAQERDRAQRVTPVCEQITGKLEFERILVLGQQVLPVELHVDLADERVGVGGRERDANRRVTGKRPV